MRFWVGYLSAAIAVAAIIAMPMDLIHHNKCCHANDAIPGVTCCGRPKVDPHGSNLVRHRTCCDPIVIQAAPSTVVTASPVRDVTAGFTDCALAGADAQVSLLFRVTVGSPRLHCDDPPLNEPPRYLVLGCFLI